MAEVQWTWQLDLAREVPAERDLRRVATRLLADAARHGAVFFGATGGLEVRLTTDRRLVLAFQGTRRGRTLSYLLTEEADLPMETTDGESSAELRAFRVGDFYIAAPSPESASAKYLEFTGDDKVAVVVDEDTVICDERGPIAPRITLRDLIAAVRESGDSTPVVLSFSMRRAAP